MTKHIDRTGQRFGRLIAILPAPSIGKTSRWLFQCDCGGQKMIRTQSVVNGSVKSCGCLHMERCKSGLNRLQHGDARIGHVTRLHSIWRGMLKRCNPTNNKVSTLRYASRGITVSPEWLNYQTFKAWAFANGYTENLTIERKDNDLGYSPQNCCWADLKTQARNRQSSRNLTVNNRTQTLAAWCEEFNISQSVVTKRLLRGWNIERSLITSVKSNGC